MSSPNNRASLGCGTLILIALIVIIFGGSNRGNDQEVGQQLRNLQSEIDGLKTNIGNQSATLTQIKQLLDEINQRSSQIRPRVVTPARPQVVPALGNPQPLPEN